MFEQRLLGLDKNGGYKEWSIEAREYVNSITDEPEVSLTIRHGKVGGKTTVKQEFNPVGKQGRTSYEQAVLEARAKIKKQMDKGYRATVEELETLPLLAMLAADYKNAKHRIRWEFGVDISDKLDGLRMVAKCVLTEGIKQVVLESRTGQVFYLPHISQELFEVMSVGEVYDGEAYLHGECLEDITSAVGRTDTQKSIDAAQRKVDKTLKVVQALMLQMGEHPEENQAYELALEELAHAQHIHELRPKLQYVLFDIPSDKPWFERLIDLAMVTASLDSPFLWAVSYTRTYNVADLKALHDDAVRRGYEGVMLRNRYGKYESGKRSADLQKYKEMISAEFLIVDIVPAKDDGCVYILMNDVNNSPFSCAYGTMFDRANALANKEERIGRWMTVDYQSRFKKTLLPQFGVGKLIRNGSVVNGQFVPSE